MLLAYQSSMLIRATLATAFAVLFAAAPAQAQTVADRSTVTESLELCELAAEADVDSRDALIERGLDLAESAVAVTASDPRAHFAVFCNLGRKLEASARGLGSLGAIRRLRRAVDTAIELDPTYVDALIGKAALLMSLPRLLGGSRTAAERCLTDALAVQPDHPVAHLYLAEVLAARGVHTTTRVATR